MRSIASWRIWDCLALISSEKLFLGCPTGTLRSKTFGFGTGIIINSFLLVGRKFLLEIVKNKVQMFKSWNQFWVAYESHLHSNIEELCQLFRYHISLVVPVPIVEESNSNCVSALLKLKMPNKMMFQLNIFLFCCGYKIEYKHVAEMNGPSWSILYNFNKIALPWSWISMVINEFWIRLNVLCVRWLNLCKVAVAWDMWANVILLKVF